MKGFTILELVVVMALAAILSSLTARWGTALARSLAMEEAASMVVTSLLAAEVSAAARGEAVLSADPAAGELELRPRSGPVTRIRLPRGVRFGFATPGATTGGGPVATGDDGVHLDGRGNRRVFLGDGLPEGSLSLAVYLVGADAGEGRPPESRAVTMSAPTGRIQVWIRQPGPGGRWVARP